MVQMPCLYYRSLLPWLINDRICDLYCSSCCPVILLIFWKITFQFWINNVASCRFKIKCVISLLQRARHVCFFFSCYFCILSFCRLFHHKFWVTFICNDPMALQHLANTLWITFTAIKIFTLRICVLYDIYGTSCFIKKYNL